MCLPAPHDDPSAVKYAIARRLRNGNRTAGYYGDQEVKAIYLALDLYSSRSTTRRHGLKKNHFIRFP